MASHCAPELKRPFVAVNPPFKPSETLKKYLSMTEDYCGNPMSLSAETVAAYPDFNCDNTCGAAAFALGDEVLDHTALIEVMQAEGFQYWPYEGGDHRFSDFHQLTDSIKNHFNRY